MENEYDFGGYVTKNDITCADGITIKHNAFSEDNGRTVPLVWNHEHDSADNVLGKITLENRNDGVYGYGSFNDNEAGRGAKELVKHGDIVAMSIFAKKLKSVGKDLLHGAIKEVSLVMSGANPGATIDYVNFAHGEDVTNGEAIIFTGEEIELDVKHADVKPEQTNTATPTINDILSTMDETQLAAVGTLVENLITATDNDNTDSETEEDETVKQNAFNKAAKKDDEYLSHDEINAIVKEARTSKGSLKEAFISHGIVGLDILFPEAKTVDRSPQIYGNINTATDIILAGIRKVPFFKVKTIVANFTEDEARARGYIKGKQKIEQIYELLKRETSPQTIYKKQALDRDDILDAEEYDIVAFTQAELRTMLHEELARAIIVGDGRLVTDESKINEDKIRPIISDDDFYTIKQKFASAEKFLEAFIKIKGQYRGSGGLTLFIQPELLADIKLVKAQDGRYLFGDIPTDASLAARLGVGRIVETTFFGDTRSAVAVNLNDYTVGAAKGGEVTTFDDFDIDFNKYKYLIETRCSGALTLPKSAIYMLEDKTYTGGTTPDTGVPKNEIETPQGQSASLPNNQTNTNNNQGGGTK